MIKEDYKMNDEIEAIMISAQTEQANQYNLPAGELSNDE